MAGARRVLFVHFDEGVHARLRLWMEDARLQLDRNSSMFWGLTRYMLDGAARFDDASLSFDLTNPPAAGIHPVRYQLALRQRDGRAAGQPYRLSHPLAEHLLERAKALDTPRSEVLFDLSAHPARIGVLEPHKGSWGWLVLSLVTVESFAREEALVLTAIDRLVHHATIFEMNVESYRRRVALERKRGPGRPPSRATINSNLIDAPRQNP